MMTIYILAMFLANFDQNISYYNSAKTLDWKDMITISKNSYI